MNKQKKAAALTYEQEKDSAPRVTAKGRGRIAEQIIEIAQENGVPVVENRNLAALLQGVDIDETIPVEMYRAVAEILVFLYTADREYAASG